jgi:glucokinase
MAMADQVLLSDISNGLYMKLALAPRGGRPDEATHYACDSLDDFKTAISDFLDAQGKPTLKGAAISAGGWEQHGVMAMPNHKFQVGRADMREFLGVQRLNLVNDCVAKALAIPRLGQDERVKICGGDEMAEQVITLINSHSGLGQASLAPDGMGGYTAMPCEGGHSDLTVDNQLEYDVYKWLAAKYGHVSRERVISIPGLVDIWSALAARDGDDAATPGPEEVVAGAVTGDDRAVQVVRLAMGWLAVMASDVALITGSRGGIYLTGDYFDLIGDLFDNDAFIARYQDKGRLSDYVRDIPVFRTLAPDMEVIGLATLFD